MKQKGASKQSQEPVSSAPRRRFRLVKLEDRIAPKKKQGGGGYTSDGGWDTSTVSY